MITLLAHFCIRDRQDYHSARVRESYGVLCGGVGIGLNLLLFVGKLIAGLLSDSIAVTADALNNLSDAGSSLILLVGFKMSGQKPDTGHPFGHGRIEYLSGFLVAVAILLMGMELIRSSVSKIFHPSQPLYSAVAVGILIASIGIKWYMYFYNRSIGRKIGSAAMAAAATDSLSDMASTFIVLVSVIAERFTGLPLDGYGGVVVGLFILYAGFRAAQDTVNPLLGQPPEPEFIEKIRQIVMQYEEIQGIHDLVVHNYGPGRTMISLHAEVSDQGKLLELHEVIDSAEKELARQLSCEAVIHLDPVCTQDVRTNSLKAMACQCLEEIDGRLSLHDFRIVEKKDCVNLLFDIVIPFEFPMTDEQVVEKLVSRIEEEREGCVPVVHVDHG